MANSDRGYYDITVYCTYKLKWKALFDGNARLDIQSVTIGVHYLESHCVSPYPNWARTDRRDRPCPNWVRTDILPGRCEPVNMLPQITACCHLTLNLHVNMFVPIYDFHSRQLTVDS